MASYPSSSCRALLILEVREAVRGELKINSILAFSLHNFRTEGFFENPRVKIQEKPKRNQQLQ